MSRLTRDGTAEPVSRDQILRHARGQGNVHFPCSADHEQDWQPYPVDPYSAICDDHTYTYIHTCNMSKFVPVCNYFLNRKKKARREPVLKTLKDSARTWVGRRVLTSASSIL